MKKVFLFIAALALCVAAGAAKPKKTKALTASAPEVKGVWKPGEEVNIFNGTSPDGSVYVCKELGFVSELQGKGAATTEDGYRCAVYPASCLRMWTPKNAHIIIPRQQTAKKDGYPEDGVLLSARSEGRSLVFEPVMGYVKFTITEDSPAVAAFVVRADKFISGTYKVRMNEPQMRVDLDNGTPRNHDVMLRSVDGKALAPGVYYVGLFARVFPDGLTVEWYAPDGSASSKIIPGQISIKKGESFDAGVIR